MTTQKIIKLTPPNLTAHGIKEKITCIRGHRERIFNVSMVQHNEKLIFHNYGQGGAGWTFLFGCVNESIRQFQEKCIADPSLLNKPICVVGAGCYGLLTAVTLARAGHQVRIVASDTHSIASYKAAGFFFPRWRKCSNEQEIATFLARGIESYKTYLAIIAGEHPFIKRGPKLLPAYYGLNIDPGFEPYIAHNLVAQPERVTIDFGSKQYEAHAYQTVFVNGGIIMQELLDNVSELKIPIIKTFINAFDEIPEEVIFNCSALGAKQLAHDARMVPVQGHLISLQNQESIDELQYMLNFKVVQTDAYGTRDELIYFAPKAEGILGITFKRGQESLTTNQHEFDRLLERCTRFFGKTQ